MRQLWPTLLLEEPVLPLGARRTRLLRELKREAYQLEKADTAGQAWCRDHYPGGYTSYGSWSRLFEMSSTFAELRDLIDAKVRRFARASHMAVKPSELAMVSLWVNVLRRGGAHGLHLHPLSTVSGTLYLSTPKRGGTFKVEDPRLSLMMAAPPRASAKPIASGLPGSFHRVKPRAGTVILFESWLRHEVEPHFDADDRVSISFNYNWF